MERRAANPFLVVLVLLGLSCLLVYSVAMPRSLRLGSQQKDLTALKLTSSQEMEIERAINMGKPGMRKPVARMDFEVDDYPPAGHNCHNGGCGGLWAH